MPADSNKAHEVGRGRISYQDFFPQKKSKTQSMRQNGRHFEVDTYTALNDAYTSFCFCRSVVDKKVTKKSQTQKNRFSCPLKRCAKHSQSLDIYFIPIPYIHLQDMD